MTEILTNIKGDFFFHKNVAGQLHCESGPAFRTSDGSEGWVVDGKLHREDGPAFTHPDGSQRWFLNGKFHRLDGPAIIETYGPQQWYIHDTEITIQVCAWIKENDFPDFTQWTDSHKIMFRLAFSGNKS